jgi:hypothetical protein
MILRYNKDFILKRCIFFFAILMLGCSSYDRSFNIVKLKFFENEKLTDDNKTEKLDIFYVIGFNSFETDSSKIIDYVKKMNEAKKYDYYEMLFCKRNSTFEKRMRNGDSTIFDNDFSEKDYIMSISFQNKSISIATYKEGKIRYSSMLKKL